MDFNCPSKEQGMIKKKIKREILAAKNKTIYAYKQNAWPAQEIS